MVTTPWVASTAPAVQPRVVQFQLKARGSKRLQEFPATLEDAHDEMLITRVYRGFIRVNHGVL